MAALQYKTFDSLMDSIELDLSRIADKDLILRERYIKTARTCNAYLGLKLNKQKEERLEISQFRADIPDDVLSILAAVAYPNGGGRCLPRPSNRCLTQFDSNSLNRLRPHPLFGVDLDENQMIFNFREGYVDIGYICQMVDEDGNLLVLDHDLTNEFYEWAVKEKIFLDLWHNNDMDVQQRLGDARQQLSLSRQRAKTIVTTPEYRTLKASIRKTELEYYNRYIKMFY